MDTKVNDEFHKWLIDKYRRHREVTTTRGVEHDYLCM